MNGQVARRARQEAEQQLAIVRGRWPHITAWARDLRRIREINHFPETIREAFQG